MRQLASIVVAALLAGCSESAAPAAIDATVADASGMDVAVDEAAVLVGEEPPQVFGPWPGMLPDVFGTSEVYSGVSPDVITTPRCVPGTTARCVCDDLREGLQGCYPEGAYRACVCPPPVPPPAQPLPPRLVRPLSGLRVTSQRPTLRWVLPDGVTRARVEVCADRPCARVIERAEVSGSSWRPTMRLPPGVAFWRVQGLNASGGVAWTSATWEFGVRHSDAPVDTAYGSLKDYNGDGYDDMVVMWGSYVAEPPDYFRANGSPSVYHGSPRGVSNTSTMQLSERLCNWGNSRASFSWYNGDFNGDGYADAVLRAAEFSGTECVGPYLYLHPGGRSGLSMEATRVGWVGVALDWYRYDVATALGDFNGDGFDDVLLLGEKEVAAYRAMVFLGGPSGVRTQGTRETSAWWMRTDGGSGETAAAGDVNGDGYADFVMFTGSTIAVLYGNPGGSPQQLVTQPRSAFMGRGHAATLDLDLDGLWDAAAGSPTTYWTSVGGSLVQTYQRYDPYRTVSGSSYGDIGGVGDVDGDGRPELIGTDFCADASNCTSGVVSLFRGTEPQNIQTATTRTHAAIVGDNNSDGMDEIVIANQENVVVYGTDGRTEVSRLRQEGSSALLLN